MGNGEGNDEEIKNQNELDALRRRQSCSAAHCCCCCNFLRMGIRNKFGESAMVSLRSDSFPRYVSRCLTNVGSAPTTENRRLQSLFFLFFFFFGSSFTSNALHRIKKTWNIYEQQQHLGKEIKAHTHPALVDTSVPARFIFFFFFSLEKKKRTKIFRALRFSSWVPYFTLAAFDFIIQTVVRTYAEKT